MRKNRILPKGKNGVQETDEEDLNNQKKKENIPVQIQPQHNQEHNSELLDEGNSSNIQSQNQSSVSSTDNYTKDELPDTEHDIKNQKQREQQLVEAMKNLKPKDQTNKLNLMVFSMFFSMLCIFA